MKLERIKRRNKTYLRIRFRFEGVNHILSLGRMDSPDDEQSAKEILSELRSEIRSGNFNGDLSKYKRKQISTTKSLAEAVKALSIVHLKESAISHATRYPEIKTRKQAKTFLYSLPVSHGVRRRYLRIYQKANPNLFGNLTVPEKDAPKTVVVFTRPELQTLIHDFRDNDPDYYPFFLILMETGCRVSEAIAFSVSDFHYHNGTLLISKAVNRKGIVKSTKNRKIRTIYTTKILKEALSSHLLHNRDNPSPTDPLIISPLGDRHIYETVLYHYQQSFKRTGLPYREPYTFRRTWITQLIKTAKLDIGTVARMAGNTPGVILSNYLGSYDQETPIDIYENIHSDLDVGWLENE